jgi:DNA-binding CsgD family transcriptional regulator
MTKEFLEECLAKGMSLAQIGEVTDRHPSTVSYHLKKHGLVPVGRAKHAPKGSLDENRLRELVSAGLTIRAIATELGLSYTAIRHHMARLGLETKRMRARRDLAELRRGGMPDQIERECPVHGLTDFRLRSERVSYTCVRCASERVSRRRREVKAILVEEAGGKCLLCGYSQSLAALEFHHRDRKMKSFGISRGGRCRSLDAARKEAEKCDLLCSNCHAAVEAGVLDLPNDVAAKVDPPDESPK